MGKTIDDYSDLVKEKHALNKTIAPVETDETDASRAYAVGEQLIFNGTLYDVIAPISQHDVITTTGSGANIAPAGPISARIKALANYQDVYGSKNIWNFNPNSDIRETADCLIAIDGNVYSFTSTGNYGGRSYVYPKLLTVGKKYHMQFKSKFTKADSIDGRIIVTPLDSWDVSGSYFRYVYTSSDADFVTKDYEFTATAEKLVFDVYVQFGTGSGNKFELKDLMIYDAEAILDDSYTPYAMTNQELTAENQNLTNDLEDEIKTRLELGAHQLMPLDLASIKARNTSGTWNGNSYTRDGVTYTVELDNYGNVIGFDVDGTGHGAPFVICPSTQITRLLNHPLIMSCNASPDLSFMAYQYNGTSNLSCNGDDVNVTFTSNNAQLQLYISSSSDKTFSHFKIYPLLRTEDDTSREFTPYAMTNKELTENVLGIVSNGNLKQISGTTPFADLKNMNIYQINSSESVSPFPGYGVAVLVIKNSSITGVQLAFCMTSSSDVSNGFMAYRVCYQGTYSNWTKISGTNVT